MAKSIRHFASYPAYIVIDHLDYPGVLGHLPNRIGNVTDIAKKHSVYVVLGDFRHMVRMSLLRLPPEVKSTGCLLDVVRCDLTPYRRPMDVSHYVYPLTSLIYWNGRCFGCC